jgi:alanine racemase
MNHTMIDLQDTAAKVGDEVIVISRDSSQPNSVRQICKTHNLFNYQFVTKLSSSIRRTVAV